MANQLMSYVRRPVMMGNTPITYQNATIFSGASADVRTRRFTALYNLTDAVKYLRITYFDGSVQTSVVVILPSANITDIVSALNAGFAGHDLVAEECDLRIKITYFGADTNSNAWVSVDSDGNAFDALGFSRIPSIAQARHGGIPYTPFSAVRDQNPPGARFVSSDEDFTALTVNRGMQQIAHNADMLRAACVDPELRQDFVSCASALVEDSGGRLWEVSAPNGPMVYYGGSEELASLFQIVDGSGREIVYDGERVVVDQVFSGQPDDWDAVTFDASVIYSDGGSILGETPYKIYQAPIFAIEGRTAVRIGTNAGGATFPLTVRPGDIAVIEGHSAVGSVTNDGEYLVESISDDRRLVTLEPLSAGDRGELAPTGGLGTITIRTGSSTRGIFLSDNIYVRTNKPLPWWADPADCRIVFSVSQTKWSWSDEERTAQSRQVRDRTTSSFELQMALLGLMGTSVTTTDDIESPLFSSMWDVTDEDSLSVGDPKITMETLARGGMQGMYSAPRPLWRTGSGLTRAEIAALDTDGLYEYLVGLWASYSGGSHLYATWGPMTWNSLLPNRRVLGDLTENYRTDGVVYPDTPVNFSAETYHTGILYRGSLLAVDIPTDVMAAAPDHTASPAAYRAWLATVAVQYRANVFEEGYRDCYVFMRKHDNGDTLSDYYTHVPISVAIYGGPSDVMLRGTDILGASISTNSNPTLVEFAIRPIHEHLSDPGTVQRRVLSGSLGIDTIALSTTKTGSPAQRERSSRGPFMVTRSGHSWQGQATYTTSVASLTFGGTDVVLTNADPSGNALPEDLRVLSSPLSETADVLPRGCTMAYVYHHNSGASGWYYLDYVDRDLQVLWLKPCGSVSSIPSFSGNLSVSLFPVDELQHGWGNSARSDTPQRDSASIHAGQYLRYFEGRRGSVSGRTSGVLGISIGDDVWDENYVADGMHISVFNPRSEGIYDDALLPPWFSWNLTNGTVDPKCPDTFGMVLRAASPAVSAMLLLAAPTEMQIHASSNATRNANPLGAYGMLAGLSSVTRKSADGDGDQKEILARSYSSGGMFFSSLREDRYSALYDPSGASPYMADVAVVPLSPAGTFVSLRGSTSDRYADYREAAEKIAEYTLDREVLYGSRWGRYSIPDFFGLVALSDVLIGGGPDEHGTDERRFLNAYNPAAALLGDILLGAPNTSYRKSVIFAGIRAADVTEVADGDNAWGAYQYRPGGLYRANRAEFEVSVAHDWVPSSVFEAAINYGNSYLRSADFVGPMNLSVSTDLLLEVGDPTATVGQSVLLASDDAILHPNFDTMLFSGGGVFAYGPLLASIILPNPLSAYLLRMRAPWWYRSAAESLDLEGETWAGGGGQYQDLRLPLSTLGEPYESMSMSYLFLDSRMVSGRRPVTSAMLEGADAGAQFTLVKATPKGAGDVAWYVVDNWNTLKKEDIGKLIQFSLSEESNCSVVFDVLTVLGTIARDVTSEDIAADIITYTEAEVTLTSPVPVVARVSNPQVFLLDLRGTASPSALLKLLGETVEYAFEGWPEQPSDDPGLPGAGRCVAGSIRLFERPWAAINGYYVHGESVTRSARPKAIGRGEHTRKTFIGPSDLQFTAYVAQGVASFKYDSSRALVVSLEQVVGGTAMEVKGLCVAPDVALISVFFPLSIDINATSDNHGEMNIQEAQLEGDVVGVSALHLTCDSSEHTAEQPQQFRIQAPAQLTSEELLINGETAQSYFSGRMKARAHLPMGSIPLRVRVYAKRLPSCNNHRFSCDLVGTGNPSIRVAGHPDDANWMLSGAHLYRYDPGRQMNYMSVLLDEDTPYSFDLFTQAAPLVYSDTYVALNDFTSDEVVVVDLTINDDVAWSNVVASNPWVTDNREYLTELEFRLHYGLVFLGAVIEYVTVDAHVLPFGNHTRDRTEHTPTKIIEYLLSHPELYEQRVMPLDPYPC